ncbi:HDOD domain-containing protein [Reinekea sp.]|jgi:putative nucleotidyltransferase with HDIG domain|uniref:HDOD domain-containing protein n=1 Tax=Reinekea sp. TaxID=1970455 RepID=UPI002A837D5E|nr:HDOD domain-containing protein [Reinekea sp.]
MDHTIFNRMTESLSQNRLVLPAFPQAALRARAVAGLADASAIAVAREVAKDPALSARILKVANSSLFGFSFNTGSLQQAISRVGLEHTKTLVTNFALMQLMTPPRGAYGLLIRTIRDHSIEVAALAYVMCEKGQAFNSNKALLGGMLHDVGYLPLIQFAKSEPDLVLTDPSFIPSLKGLHTEAGNLLMMYWQFSPELVEVVSAHESIACRMDEPVTLRDVIALANAIVNEPDSGAREMLLSSPLAVKLAVTELAEADYRRVAEVKQFFS